MLLERLKSPSRPQKEARRQPMGQRPFWTMLRKMPFGRGIEKTSYRLHCSQPTIRESLAQESFTCYLLFNADHTVFIDRTSISHHKDRHRFWRTVTNLIKIFVSASIPPLLLLLLLLHRKHLVFFLPSAFTLQPPRLRRSVSKHTQRAALRAHICYRKLQVHSTREDL